MRFTTSALAVAALTSSSFAIDACSDAKTKYVTITDVETVTVPPAPTTTAEAIVTSEAPVCGLTVYETVTDRKTVTVMPTYGVTTETVLQTIESTVIVSPVPVAESSAAPVLAESSAAVSYVTPVSSTQAAEAISTPAVSPSTAGPSTVYVSPVPVSSEAAAVPASSSPAAVYSSPSSSSTSTKTTAAVAATSSASSGSSGSSGSVALGSTKRGEATFYGGNVSGGMCSFSSYSLPSSLFGTALSDSNWDDAGNCGACVEVSYGGQSIKAMIVDQCPGCGTNHLDLFQDAFTQLADASIGIIDVSWKIVECGITSPIELVNKEGTSEYWFSMQVVNANIPVDKLEVSTDNGSTWQETTRAEYNFFENDSGFGTDTVSVRVTSITGSTVVTHNVPVTGSKTCGENL